MNRAVALLAILPAVLSLGGCARLNSKIPGEANPKPQIGLPKLVGRIATVPKDQRFVLIQSYGAWTVPAGSILTTRGAEDRTANLLATGETLGQFAAADVQAGLVETGDAVYSRPIPSPAAATMPPVASPVENSPNMPKSKEYQIFKDN